MEKTELRMELNLIFDNYSDMSLITKKIGMNPSAEKCKKDTRKSPFKDGNLPGYWSIETDNFETLDLSEVTKYLVEKMNPYLEKIKSALQEYDGEARFCVVAEMEDSIPALYFNRDFLEMVEYLKADIDIDMYGDLAGVEYCTE
jgi:hypothetical protein